MPLYLDLHKIQSKAKESHDFIPEESSLNELNSLRCLSCWIDVQNNQIVSLVDVPGKKALKRQLNSQELHEIIPVNSKVAEVFLDRIRQKPILSGKEKKRFQVIKNEDAVRVHLVVTIEDPYLLKYQLGEQDFSFFHEYFQKTIEDLIPQYQGKQIHCQKNYCVASFISVFSALHCAVQFKRELSAMQETAKVELLIVPSHAVEKPEPTTAFHFHAATRSAIVIAPQVKEMCGATLMSFKEFQSCLYWLTPSEEIFLRSLHKVLNQNWQNPGFNCRAFCRGISMSKASLYRKSTAVTGKSPNVLIKEFRLLQALTLLRLGESVTRTCYDAGFNSVSYFSRCFQQQYKIQPGSYRKLCDA